MTFTDIKIIARERGVRISGVKKVEIVRAIQVQEGNVPCFGTGRAADCGQGRCLWITACD